MKIVEATHHGAWRDGQRWSILIDDNGETVRVEAKGATRAEAETDALSTARGRLRLTDQQRQEMKRNSRMLQRGLR